MLPRDNGAAVSSFHLRMPGDGFGPTGHRQPGETEGRFPRQSLAKTVAEEISEADWNRLRYSYLQTKQYWTDHTDPDKIDAHFPPEVVAGNGSMVGYYEIFPYAKPVEFTVGAQTWPLDDQYCVNPNCSCQEAVLSFFPLRLFAEPSRIPTEPSLSIRYAYNIGRIEPLPAAEDGRLSGQEFVEALRKVLPDLNSLLAKRQALLQRLYRRASRGKTIQLHAPKLGRVGNTCLRLECAHDGSQRWNETQYLRGVLAARGGRDTGLMFTYSI